MSPSITPNRYGLFIPQPQPRSLEELHAERSYLLSSLQQENIKATNLIRKLLPLEETLVLSEISHVRRRTRKQIGWLRYRISEITRQEMTILNSLGQLGQEIQSRESWNQVQCEKLQSEQSFNNQVIVCQQMQQLNFTPITPQHQLQEYPFPYMQTPLQQQYEAGGYSWHQKVFDYTADMPSQISSPMKPSGDQCLAENLASNSERNDLATATLYESTEGQRCSSMNILDVELTKTHTPPVTISEYKRHSTGGKGVPKIWSDKKEPEVECKEESSEGSQYSGFYINEKVMGLKDVEKSF